MTDPKDAEDFRRRVYEHAKQVRQQRRAERIALAVIVLSIGLTGAVLFIELGQTVGAVIDRVMMKEDGE